MSKNYFKIIAAAYMAIALTACESNDEPQAPSAFNYTNGAYVLNFGSGTNSSTLSHYSFINNEVTNNVFQLMNEEIIGDQANHMCTYGAKLYIALSGSGKIEVTDIHGKQLRKIELKDEGGLPLKPRYMASHGKYVYFTSYGGLVQRIDTASLNLDNKFVKVGDFPEALTVASNKLFVNNSKYKNANVNDKGNTVTVIDLNSFEKTAEIEVSSNPYNQSLTASDGNVYIVTVGDWSNPQLQRINPETYEVTTLGQASVIAEYNNTLYTYFSVWNGASWFKSYNLTTGELSSEDFLDASKFSYIQALNINPTTGDLYVSDAPYGEKGKVYIYNKAGEEKQSFEVGYSPAGVFFPTQK